MSFRGSGNYDPVTVLIYPSNNKSATGRRWTLLIATLSTTALLAAVFGLVASLLVWTGHIGRRTPVATNLINHYAESESQ